VNSKRKLKNGRKSPLFAIEAEMKYPDDKKSTIKYLDKLAQELALERKKLLKQLLKDHKDIQEKRKDTNIKQ